MDFERWWANLSAEFKEIISENIQEQQEYKLRISIENIEGFILENPELVSNITALNCSSTTISSLSEISVLINIEKIDCGDSPINDIDALKFFTNLEKLDLMNCANVKNIDCLADLTGLRMIELSGTSVESISVLSNKSYLHKLACINTNLSSIQALKGCSKLRELSIAGTPVSDISPIFENTRLRILSCGGSNIPINQIEYYKKRNPFCKIIM